MEEEPGFYAISTMIARKLAGELTREEQTELDRWIDESPENKKVHDLAIDPVYRQQRDRFVADIDVEAALQRVNHKIFKQRRRQMRLGWYSVAAAILFLCAATITFYVYRSGGDTTAREQATRIASGSSQAVVKLSDGRTVVLAGPGNQDSVFAEGGVDVLNDNGGLTYAAGSAGTDELVYNEILIPRGGEYTVTLSDGTKVWLNSETQLRYPVRFVKDKRVVELTGEAFFEVTPDADKPFIVKARGTDAIQVYGTQFNVNAYGDSPQSVVTLNEGSVSVTRANSRPVMLVPGQQAHWTAETPVAVASVDAAQFSAWKDGLLVFDNMSLQDISTLLSRWYNVTIVFEDEHLKTHRFTADIKRYGTFGDVLNVFEKTNLLSFEIDGATVRIRAKKAR